MSVEGARDTRAGRDASSAYSLVATPPQPYGRYTLIGKLGRGGMAEVNLSVAEGKGGFRKLVVIKRLHEHLAVEPGFVDMFLDEARLAARLNHPHCVQTYEVGDHGDSHFLAMEYLDGQGLERLLRISGQQGRPIPVELCARIVADALDGLAYAHELTDFDGTPMTVVHRDVSPQNIFVTYNGMVKLLDFGIAKAATHIVETKTGVIKGKYAYIAPEQALGQDVDQRSDLWSMGVVLWETLTGRRLFKSVNELATLHETLQGEVKLPSAFRPDLPTELDTICMRALTREPDERYQTAQEMKDDLERYLHSLQKVPGRKQIASLMRRRFEEVILLHKETLAECLKAGGAQLSPSSMQRLVDPGSYSASGIRTSGATPTPTPYSYPPPAGTPSGVGVPPSVAAPPPPASDRGGLAIKALLILAVILLAIIAALVLPLGGSDDDQGAGRGDSVAAATTVAAGDPAAGDPAGDPGGADTALDPNAVLHIEPQMLDTAPGGEPGDAEGTEPAPLAVAPGTDSPGTDPTTDGSGSTEPEAVGEGGSSNSAAQRRRAERRARLARQRREREAEEAAATAAEAPPPEPRPQPAAETGRLSLVTTPWTRVTWNGRDLGTTPLINVEMPAGAHTLRLVNQEQGINETYRVRIRAGQRTPVRLGLSP